MHIIDTLQRPNSNQNFEDLLDKKNDWLVLLELLCSTFAQSSFSIREVLANLYFSILK